MPLLLNLAAPAGGSQATPAREEPSFPSPVRAVYKGHNLPRLRGVMSGYDTREEYFRVLGEEWNANLIRWQVIWRDAKNRPSVADDTDMAAYRNWLDSALQQLDQVVRWCERYRILVVIALLTPPAESTKGGTNLIHQKKEYQDQLVETWKTIARRYRGRKIIWGYDLANEPNEGKLEEGSVSWHDLATRTATAIREIDPDTAIIIEAAEPHGFHSLRPIEVQGVVYSVHMYAPGAFTHQGVDGRPAGFLYPGHVDGTYWNKEKLRERLRPMIDFQQRYGVHIYVGEFSAVRWAPDDSAYRYLRDVIELFEEYDWDWSYHAFREWDGWSVEHGPDRMDTTPSARRTSREKLLREWFAKNRKP